MNHASHVCDVEDNVELHHSRGQGKNLWKIGRGASLSYALALYQVCTNAVKNGKTMNVQKTVGLRFSPKKKCTI